MRPRFYFVVTFTLVGKVLSVQAQSTYPVVSQAEQRLRDEDRRAILQAELNTEREMLAKAQTTLVVASNQESSTEMHRHSENVKALLRELEGTAEKRTPGSSRITIKANRQAANRSISEAKGAASFWDPYNRTPDVSSYQTTQRKESQ
jgi:lysyl-tRNA synthetase class I